MPVIVTAIIMAIIASASRREMKETQSPKRADALERLEFSLLFFDNHIKSLSGRGPLCVRALCKSSGNGDILD